MMKRNDFATLIYEKIDADKENCAKQFAATKKDIGYFYIDNLLPEALVLEIYNKFPKTEEMVHKKSIREDKYIAVQMNLYAPVLEEIIYAFQDERIVKIIGEICQKTDIFPDENLYAGGLSMMGKAQYLNPHLDNSHDKERENWRVMNLLFYVTPNWEENFGGNLELWPNGLQEKQITIASKFNRLAVMATHNSSLHSVSPVQTDRNRCCVSNYYFSKTPMLQKDTFHVTSFRGRPENKFTDLVLQMDSMLRMTIRKLFKKGIKENPHVYKKE